MSTPDSDPAANLARNLRSLREQRGLTQQQMARRSGVPRPTWANLESGSANPTLAVLTRVAAAFQISIEELISPPRAQARHYPAESLPTRRRGGVEVRRMLPDVVSGIEMERFELAPGSRMRGVPHTAGTREYLSCERGSLQLSASGEMWALKEGDVVVFRGDQKHGYHNPGDEVAVAYSVILLAPVV